MLVYSRRAALAAAFALASLSAAYAGEAKYSAKLDAASETPPNSSAATGSVEALFDSSTKTLSWTVTYSGLTGPAIAAHFHGPAPKGQSAGVLVPITGALASPIKGSAQLTDDQIKELAEGQVYFNVHTEAHKAGEIRGQLTLAGN